MFRYLPPAGTGITVKEIVKALLLRNKSASTEIFTQILKDLLKVRYCFLTSSGTVALYLTLVSLKKLVNKNEVVVSAYTCPSILAAIIRAGLKPVLCDLDREKSNLNLTELAHTITSKTLAVISVHLFGIKENINDINELTSSRKIFHIEDAAQSFVPPAVHNQEMLQSHRASSTGTVGIFSFGRGKPLTLLQGGAITTDSDTIAQALRETMEGLDEQGMLDTAVLILKTLLYAVFFHPRLYWIAQRTPFLKLGKTIFNLDFATKPINPFTSALGSIMIDRALHFTMLRRQKEKLLSELLSDFTNLFLTGNQGSPPLLRFPLLMENKSQRELVLSRLKKYGLGATSMYEAPLHLFKDTKKYFPGSNHFSNAQSFSERIVTLPLHTYITENDASRISTIIQNCVNKN